MLSCTCNVWPNSVCDVAVPRGFARLRRRKWRWQCGAVLANGAGSWRLLKLWNCRRKRRWRLPRLLKTEVEVAKFKVCNCRRNGTLVVRM